MYDGLYRYYKKLPLSLRLRLRNLAPSVRGAASPPPRKKVQLHDPEAVAVFAESVGADGGRIVDRVVAAYRRSAAGDYYGQDSMWRTFREERHQELHELLVHGPREKLVEALSSPRDYNLLYGFETLYKEYHEAVARNPLHARQVGARLKDQLMRLSEAIGMFRVENPDGPGAENPSFTVSELIAALERELGFPLDVPAVYAGLEGLPRPGGVLTNRMIEAAYCASRVKRLASGAVLEIGGGVGFFAYYVHRLKLDITIVDLPMTNVAQGYFLMRALGEDAVVLEGEPPRPGAIKVLTPGHLESGPRYDLVVNVDSLTEVGRDVAEGYLRWIMKNSRRFWSVNHEANIFTVNELLKEFPGATVERFPYWMRSGYVEEIITCR
ncbi:MAG TPA: putative sugar O-methyltransferase [Pyrinomonadaceae bacterium]|jgi:putative sugar O-methyltransferase|nr:putative sugar O-methyltransferase [Pyrinomonadaceae bacterium]